MSEKVTKDVIYIDIEDDITDVVNKVKSSKEKILAIVPPKGVGVLRSAVNIRLLARTAEKFEKKIVIVTNNSALKTMSAAAKIPVAKTLQSKPEIPEIDILEVEGEDVIDGESLPISEFTGKSKEETEAEMLENLDIDDNKEFSKKEPEIKNERTNKAKKTSKVPDFNKFRKKIFIFGGLGCVLIAFFVWAVVFAPFATITIKAKTSESNISKIITLSSEKSSPSEGIVLSKAESVEKTAEVLFDVTGTKEEGEAASGKITLTRSGDSDPLVVAQGSSFSAGECNFVTTSSVTVPGASLRGGSITPGVATVGIKATKIGGQCNLESQKYIASISGISAVGGKLSGGSKKTLKVVSQADIDNAKAKLATADSDSIKAELKAKISSDYVVIDESFSSQTGDATSSVAVDQEAPNGKATLKASTKYSIVAVEKNSLDSAIKEFAKEKLSDEANQNIYSSGVDNATFSKFSGNAVNISANVKIGPKIETSELSNKIKGKKSGEVRSLVESIEGVESVDVKFSFFWVNSVPNDDNKIKINFTVDE